MPAFLHAAMVEQGLPVAVPNVLPGILGVRVLPDDDNPLGLATADATHPPGLRAADADREINRLLRELESPLRLRRIPFKEIDFGLWEDVLDAALSRPLTVGLGLNHAVLTGQLSPRSAQHVLRIAGREPRVLRLFDDSGESSPPLILASLERASHAVLAIPDGFWMIGAVDDLRLPGTLPWTPAP